MIRRLICCSTILVITAAFASTALAQPVVSPDAKSDLAEKPAVQAKSVDADATKLFPSRCAGYIEVPDAKSLIDLVMNHPLRKKIEQFDEIKEALESKDMFKFRAAVVLVEGHIGMPWDEAIAFVSSGGIHVAFDPETDGLALIARSSDEDQLKKMFAGLLKLSRLDPNTAKEIKKQDYRGIKAYEVRDTIVALMGKNLVVSNKGDFAKVIADNYLDGTSDSLSTNSRFAKAKTARSSEAAAWAWADLDLIRQAPKVKKGLEGKAENIAVEFLVGGIQSILKETPFATVELHAANDGIKLLASVPHNADWVPESREFFFGEGGNETAPAMMVPENTVLNITAHRDLSAMWLAKEDLLNEKDISELAQADSTLSTIFGGLNFGEEVLGAAKPGIQIIAKQQDYSKIATPEPEVKIPSFAFVFQLKEPEKVQRRFKVAYQSMVGFLNVQLGMQEMPQLDLETTKENGAIVTSATYLPDVDGEEGLINYNFSPTIAFKDDYFVLSSTVELANELIDLTGGNTESISTGTNTLMRIDGQVLTDILAENRESLISQNMLEDGNSREEAEKTIGILVDLMKMAGDTEMRLFAGQEKLNLEFIIGLQVE